MARKAYVELEQTVKGKGVVTLSMEKLRDVFGYQRLGSNVRREIEDTLRDSGIDFVPEHLPNREQAMIRLFPAESEMKALIQAAVTLDPDWDTFLAQATKELTPQQKPKQPQAKKGPGRPRKQRLLTQS